MTPQSNTRVATTQVATAEMQPAGRRQRSRTANAPRSRHAPTAPTLAVWQARNARQRAYREPAYAVARQHKAAEREAGCRSRVA